MTAGLGVTLSSQDRVRLAVDIVVQAVEIESANRRLAMDSGLPVDIAQRSEDLAEEWAQTREKACEALRRNGWAAAAVDELVGAARHVNAVAVAIDEEVAEVHRRFRDRREGAVRRLAAAREGGPQ